MVALGGEEQEAHRDQALGGIMSYQQYKEKNFRRDALALIMVMESIVDEYVAQGYRLTVRQLYYQLVARGVIENTERSYARITSTVNDAKLAGLMDWEAIEDRTREFLRRSHWASASELVESAADQFHMDMWIGQENRVFVIVEKEALAGVLHRACRRLDVPLLAARGYPSGTVLREFAQSDLIPCLQGEQTPIVLHLGDHDPSGIDMTRDLDSRLCLFAEGFVELNRIALTMDQIDEHRPPPNPAKTTDSRFADYRRKYGDESWELDALKPDYLDDLVSQHIAEYIDEDQWDKRVKLIKEGSASIKKAAEGLKPSLKRRKNERR